MLIYVSKRDFSIALVFTANFQPSKKLEMATVENTMNLNRFDFIACAIMLGCDFAPSGINGVLGAGLGGKGSSKACSLGLDRVGGVGTCVSWTGGGVTVSPGPLHVVAVLVSGGGAPGPSVLQLV